MTSLVIQIDESDLPALSRVGVAFKDVTERERHLKLTIVRLKCEIAGDAKRYYVIERAKYGHLARIAEAARRLPLDSLARTHPAEASALGDALTALGTLASLG